MIARLVLVNLISFKLTFLDSVLSTCPSWAQEYSAERTAVSAGCSIFKAEVIAIKYYAYTIAEQDTKNKFIAICSDSQAALNAINFAG